MRKFLVTNQYDMSDETAIEVTEMNEKELRDLASYYNEHQDVAEDIDFETLPLEKVITFVERIDKVEEI